MFNSKRMTVNILTVLLAVFVSADLFAADWLQWRGLNRDGRSPETGLLQAWPESGPELVWSTEGLGEGWSSASVVDGKVYITGKEGRDEYLVIIDDKTGKILHKKKYGSVTRRSYPDARTTPNVDGDRVYVISGAGEVVCLNIDNAETLWYVNAFEKFNGKTGSWGIAESPLVDDKCVYYTVCGPETTLIALNKKDGELVWKTRSLDDNSAYVSPIMIQRGGKRLIVGVTARYIIGVDAADGTLLWNYPYAQKHPASRERLGYINANTPLYHDGEIYVTSGYDHVGVMLTVAEDGKEVSLKWVNKELDTHHGGVVRDNGCIFGASWEGNADGKWMCLDWNTGKLKWEHHWEGKGSIIYAEGMLYCYEENNANLALIKADPDGFKPYGTLHMKEGKGKSWSHPTISDGRLYVRHGNVLNVYNIRKK